MELNRNNITVNLLSGFIHKQRQQEYLEKQPKDKLKALEEAVAKRFWLKHQEEAEQRAIEEARLAKKRALEEEIRREKELKNEEILA